MFMRLSWAGVMTCRWYWAKRMASWSNSFSASMVTGMLSQTLRASILRRASARGKALPEILKKALEQQVERMREDGDGSS